jgi:hypothetical protein
LVCKVGEKVEGIRKPTVADGSTVWIEIGEQISVTDIARKLFLCREVRSEEGAAWFRKHALLPVGEYV